MGSGGTAQHTPGDLALPELLPINHRHAVLGTGPGVTSDPIPPGAVRAWAPPVPCSKVLAHARMTGHARDAEPKPTRRFFTFWSPNAPKPSETPILPQNGHTQGACMVLSQAPWHPPTRVTQLRPKNPSLKQEEGRRLFLPP